MDTDISCENKAKLRYARQHFNRVNKLQSEYKYYFKFLSPSSYDIFFHDLREGKYKAFKSKIEAASISSAGEPDQKKKHRKNRKKIGLRKRKRSF